jgi:hypothetical protein
MKKLSLSFYDPNIKAEFTSLPISRQTITRSGQLGDYTYYYNKLDADWHIVGTWIDNIDDIKGKRILYLQQEPPQIRVPSKKILDDCSLLLSFFDLQHHIPQMIVPPPLQWTYDISAKMVPKKGHVYNKQNNLNLSDYLFSPIPKKTKKCSIIVSTKIITEGHKRRLIFVNELQKRFKDQSY